MRFSIIYFEFQSTFKMKTPEEELAEIKSMMERSTRFLSLSGFSGMLAGMYALAASVTAWYWIYFPSSSWGTGSDTLSFRELVNRLLLLGLATLIAAVGTAYFFKQKERVGCNPPLLVPSQQALLTVLISSRGLRRLLLLCLAARKCFRTYSCSHAPFLRHRLGTICSIYPREDQKFRLYSTPLGLDCCILSRFWTALLVTRFWPIPCNLWNPDVLPI